MTVRYFKRIENLLEDYRHIIEDHILSKQTFTREKGVIEGEVYFIDYSQLDFNEVINTNLSGKQKYSYHFMNENKELIFRYDNVPHHPEIKSFPHHKHVKSGIFESTELDLHRVLIEIEKRILDNPS